MISRRAILGTPALALLAATLDACGPDWREYRSEDGRYRVRFPEGPLTERKRGDGTQTVHIVTRTVDDLTAFGVAWYDVADPGKPLSDLLREVQAGSLRDLNAALIRAGEINLGDAPGRFFTAQTDKSLYMSVRIYAVGSGPVRIYQLIAAVPDLGRADRDTRNFFDSFALVK